MPASNKDDLSIRLSVTETKVVNIEGDLGEYKTVLKDISVKVDGLKERFDKMNGAIPHIESSLANIDKHLESVTDTSYEQETKIIKNTLYIRLLWGLVVPVVLTVTGAFIKIVFFGN